jgi:lipopolysaccharide biosynthesis glycosyltransferase
VILVTGGLDAPEFEMLRSSLADDGVDVLDSSNEIAFLLKEFDFGDNHVTPMTLGRLLLHDILPPQYQHILYLDGDTYVAGDVKELFRLRVPEGRIAASLDSLFLNLDGTSEFAHKLRDYRTKHSSGPAERYFNGGVLAASRATWRKIGPQALTFYRDYSEDCIYHDQSALNIICENAVEWLSPAYNFLTDYQLMGFGLYVHPRLLHFSGASKPWNSWINPWPLGIYGEYKWLIAQHPSLAIFSKSLGIDEKRRFRNRLISHILNDAPGLKRPAHILKKHAYFKHYLANTSFALT